MNLKHIIQNDYKIIVVPLRPKDTVSMDVDVDEDEGIGNIFLNDIKIKVYFGSARWRDGASVRVVLFEENDRSSMIFIPQSWTHDNNSTEIIREIERYQNKEREFYWHPNNENSIIGDVVELKLK